MTHEDIKNIIGSLYPGHLTVERYQSLYMDAELKLFYRLHTAGRMDALSGFRVVMGDGTDPLHVTQGVAPLPSDYFCSPGGYYMNGTVPTLVNFVEDNEYNRLIAHVYEYPDAKHPIANIQVDSIRVRPTTVKFIVMNYISHPTEPVYATTEDRGFVEFDATGSTAVRWVGPEIVLLIQEILQSLGVIATQSEIQSKIANQNPS